MGDRADVTLEYGMKKFAYLVAVLGCMLSHLRAPARADDIVVCVTL
jgi:hypothetical protein